MIFIGLDIGKSNNEIDAASTAYVCECSSDRLFKKNIDKYNFFNSVVNESGIMRKINCCSEHISGGHQTHCKININAACNAVIHVELKNYKWMTADVCSVVVSDLRGIDAILINPMHATREIFVKMNNLSLRAVGIYKPASKSIGSIYERSITYWYIPAFVCYNSGNILFPEIDRTSYFIGNASAIHDRG